MNLKKIEKDFQVELDDFLPDWLIDTKGQPDGKEWIEMRERLSRALRKAIKQVVESVPVEEYFKIDLIDEGYGADAKVILLDSIKQWKEEILKELEEEK